MRTFRIIPVLLMITAQYAAGTGITATTDDGRKVLLKSDGTWEYVKAKKSTAGKKQAAAHVSLVDIIKNDRHYDFRTTRWGMNKKEVMASEKTAKVIKDAGDTLEYEVAFLKYQCSVVYAFHDNALVSAVFVIRQPHVDPALYYRDYIDLKQYLTPIYGTAVTDKCDWKNEMYRKDRSKWGFAVSLGFLTCRTVWHDKRTQISLVISGGNHQITTNIEYSEFNRQ